MEILNILEKGILGRKISSIVFVGDYIQICFQPEENKVSLSLNIYTDTRMDDNGRCLSLGDVISRDIMGIISDIVIKVSKDDENYVILLSGGKKLLLKITGDEYGLIGAVDGADF